MKKIEYVARKSTPAGKRPLLGAFRTSGGAAGVISYSVMTTDILSNEKRRERRRRTRLRAGKVLDRHNRFWIDAAIVDRSCGGLRLRLARDVEVPDPFHFFDDEIEAIFVARIAWRNRQVLGVRRGPRVSATARELASLRGKFYAMPD